MERFAGNGGFVTPNMALGMKGLPDEIAAFHNIDISQRQRANAQLGKYQGNPGSDPTYSQKHDMGIAQTLLLAQA